MLSPSFIFRPTGTGNIENDKTRLGALRLDRSRPLKVRPGCRYICWHPPSARLRAYLRSAVVRPLPVALTGTLAETSKSSDLIMNTAGVPDLGNVTSPVWGKKKRRLRFLTRKRARAGAAIPGRGHP